jgi:DNA ligase-1
MNFPTLFKIDTKGKVREWEVLVEDNGDYAEIFVTHGEHGGQKQVKSTIVEYGKNIGKANETSYLEQAYSEAKSKWDKQHHKGYSVNGTKQFRPMLANDYKKHFKKVKYPCYVQPKLDGFRCTLQLENDKVVGRSRRGIEWKTIDHILISVTDYLKQNPYYILDGEIYTDKISFQKICSAIKRDEVNDESLLAEFHCYDLFDTTRPEITFEERFSLIPKLDSPFINVFTNLCLDKNEIVKYHDEYVAKGYEGAIIRNKLGKYKIDARSSDLLKFKNFEDAEYEIIGINEDKNGEAVFLCIDTMLNKTFSCKPKGTHEERVEMLNEDNIGKMLTVRYFELTSDGIPRFPVGVAIRLEQD